MKTLSYFAASAAQVARHPVAVLKLEWKGASGLAAGRFLQVHDAYATPPDTDSVPLKVWPIYTDAPGFKLFDVGELVLQNGLYICISTTEATKTLASGADDFSSLLVELREAEQPSGTTYAGDLTTDEETIAVWDEDDGPKKLFEIIAKNNENETFFLQIHAADTPTSASLVESFAIAAGVTERLAFGKDGRDVRRIVSEALKQGCTLAWSSTAGTYTSPGGSIGPIQAEFK